MMIIRIIAISLVLTIFRIHYVTTQTSVANETQTADMSEICEQSYVTENEVLKTIFNNYSNIMRPLKQASKSLDVKIALQLRRIESISEKMGTVTLSGYLVLKWVDEFLAWSWRFPLLCIDELSIPGEQMFRPDVVLLNSEDKYEMTLAKGHRVILKSNGEAGYYPSGTFTIECEFNLRNFPFDHQQCTIEISTWAYPKAQQHFTLIEPPFFLENFTQAEQWHLYKTDTQLRTIHYADSDRDWEVVEFKLFLRRKSEYYIINIIVPSTIISIVELSTFALPLEKAMKVHISFTALLAYSVFQLMIINDIPRTSENAPLLSIHIDLSMAYIGFVLLGEGVVFWLLGLARRSTRKGPPMWLYKAMAWLGSLFAIKPKPDLIEHLKLLHKTSKSKPVLQTLFYTAVSLQAVDLFKKNLTKACNVELGEADSSQVHINSDAIGSPEAGQQGHLNAIINGDHRVGPPNPRTQQNPTGTLQESAVESMPQVDVPSDGAAILAASSIREMWSLLARVVEALTLLLYLIAIIITPLIIFCIIPLVENA